MYMKLEKLYIGSWFQRTTLHLSEIYDFLQGEPSPLKELERAKLTKLRKALELKHVEMRPGDLSYIHFTSAGGITVHIYEDGLINLSTAPAGKDPLKDSAARLRMYYEDKLSPAIKYLFSLGAPLPKELANIKTIYPYFAITRNTTPAAVKAALAKVGEHEHLELHQKEFSLYRGNTFYVIDRKRSDPETIEKLVEEYIFMREFQGQLHRYLNLHRLIWERIADVKERGAIKGKDIDAFKGKLESYAKTITLIDTRIDQMGSYLHTRGSVVKNDERLRSLLGVLQFKHETLGDTLDYIKDLWGMTKNYVQSAFNLFSDLQAEATQRSVENLTIVTSMGVGATLIGLFTTTEAPSFTMFGIGYFLALALIGYAANKIMSRIAMRRKYEISEAEPDTKIE